MTSLVPSGYEGREQALVKHELLKHYLEKLVLIIGMSAGKTGYAEICYVDCFAGPWGTSDEELEGTSISLSLRTLERCQTSLAAQGVKVKMRALYIEKSRRAFKRLSAYLGTRAPSTIDHHCLNGDFVELRDEILKWCGRDAFVFFFVDPKGWKEIDVETMRPLLHRTRSEFLINFAYNFINRTASMAEWQDAIVRLLGTVKLEGLQPAEREEALVNAYREVLRSCVPAGRKPYRARTAYVTIRDPLQQRTKYHLVYLTSHPTGIIKFMEISEQVDLVQRRVRAATRLDAREKKTGIVDMFTSDSDAALEHAEGERTPEEVDAYWMRYLAGGERRVDPAAFADILEETNWLPADLQASIGRLIKAGVVTNLDANTLVRRKRPLHFEKAERLVIL